MTVILIRCQNGIVVWVKIVHSPHSASWVCGDDGFAIAAPTTAIGAKSALLSMAQHSIALAGSILQVVQLNL